MTTPTEPTPQKPDPTEPAASAPAASEGGLANPDHRRRVISVAVAALLAAALLVLGWWWLSGVRDSAPSAAPEPTSSRSPSASSSASPSDLPTTAPGATATPGPGSTPPTPTSDPAVPSERATQAPVDLTESAEPAAGLSARLTTVESVTGVTTLPGEVGGPALRVTVQFTNSTADSVDLAGAVVNLYYGADMVPTIGLIEPGQQPFPASVAPGGVASGRFIFLVPAESRDHVTVEVDVAAQTPVVLFDGAAPAA